VPLGRRSSLTNGAAAVTAATSGRTSTTAAQLLIARVKWRSALAGSNAAGSSANCISLRALRSGCASISARGVGTMPSGVRTNRSSLSICRKRLSAWLIAGWLDPIRLPARVTLRSCIAALKTMSRLRSNAPQFMTTITHCLTRGRGKLEARIRRRSTNRITGHSILRVGSVNSFATCQSVTNAFAALRFHTYVGPAINNRIGKLETGGFHHAKENVMTGKLKIAIISLMMLGTASAAMAEGYDPNLANRYPAYADPVAAAPHAMFHSASVRFEGRNAALTDGYNHNYGGQPSIIEVGDHASSPYAGGGGK
jgi:hypothetical protein